MMKTKMACELPVEDLVAYVDGELTEGRRAVVEAALGASPACRREVAQVREVGRLLRERTPLVDDLVGRAETRARVQVEAGRRARPWRIPSARFAMPLVLLALLLAGLPAASGVGADLERRVQDAADGLQTVLGIGAGAPEGGGSAATDYRYGAGATADLPNGLQQVARTMSNPALFELRHWNPAQVIVSRSQATDDEWDQAPAGWTPPWQTGPMIGCQPQVGGSNRIPPFGAQNGRRCD